ncbi:MAG: multifunctional CCA tRNA nucleotidyl transferase/2'3'-cyclic phosphodiesterase/2'nucleotidase/phosphatase [Halofilum sp. (in: g-proteobacteria)]|nr:multifunctional CCA tRNA nucleotidyl transferase/2'3'-cyclic phosphodiesterase/2'nucleotidase/phosphatase [Halofilum sp. (in: g-proteobacteria)]
METYLVGGAVRDELLGRTPTERDWVVVGATPEALEAAGYRRVGRDFPVFLHPETGEEHALARRERKAGHGYHGFDVHAGPEVTLEEDLGRRDLTINAIARAADGTLVDPHDGRADLEARTLRHVSPAFVEDPLRVLRVARFAARLAPLGFRVADETRALMREIAASGELDYLVPERVWQETARALGEPAPARFFDELAACDALAAVFPELAPLFAPGATDAGRAALQAAAAADEPAAVRFAALCHPLAPEHALAALCARLPVPRAWADPARLVARWHVAVITAVDADGDGLWAVLAGCDALRRGERFEQVLAACRAIARAQGRERAAEAGGARLRAAREAARAVDGAALARAGWRGAELGAELERRRRAAVAAVAGGGPSPEAGR